MSRIELLYIDLFCGAGGTSSGVEYATVDGRKCAEVIACVNHDENAIKSHAANHPKTMHFTEDITEGGDNQGGNQGGGTTGGELEG